MKIEKGDMVRFRTSSNYPRRKDKIYSVTDVRNAWSYRSGIKIQVEGTKAYFDSGYFELVTKSYFLNFSL